MFFILIKKWLYFRNFRGDYIPRRNTSFCQYICRGVKFKSVSFFGMNLLGKHFGMVNIVEHLYILGVYDGYG